MNYTEFKVLETILRSEGYHRYCPDWLKDKILAGYPDDTTAWVTGFRQLDDDTGAVIDWQVFIIDLDGVGIVRYNEPLENS